MDVQTRTAIIAAAFAAAGPVGVDDDPQAARAAHRARVIELIADITVTADDEKSWANKAIDQVTGPTVKIFTGTVVKVTKDERNTRGVVTLRTKVHPEFSPDGTETVNTERTDSLDGMSMARKLRALKGHKVLLRVQMEQFTTKSGQSRKSRVVRHVEDLGEDRGDAETLST